MTSNLGRGKPDGGSVRPLRVVARIAVLIGALGSVGLMLCVGRRNPSRLLLVLFGIWDLSPFVGLVLADFVSKGWPVRSRAMLHWAMLILTLGSLAFYGDVVWRPRPQPAFMFLVVPLASWLVIAIVAAARRNDWL